MKDPLTRAERKLKLACKHRQVFDYHSTPPKSAGENLSAFAGKLAQNQLYFNIANINTAKCSIGSGAMLRGLACQDIPGATVKFNTKSSIFKSDQEPA